MPESIEPLEPEHAHTADALILVGFTAIGTEFPVEPGIAVVALLVLEPGIVESLRAEQFRSAKPWDLVTPAGGRILGAWRSGRRLAPGSQAGLRGVGWLRNHGVHR